MPNNLLRVADLTPEQVLSAHKEWEKECNRWTGFTWGIFGYTIEFVFYRRWLKVAAIYHGNKLIKRLESPDAIR